MPVVKNTDYQVWVKVPEDGCKAIGLFNLSQNELKISVNWVDAGL